LSTMRSVSSRISASRTALRLMPNSPARSRSEGSLSPGLKPRSRINPSNLLVCSRPSIDSPGLAVAADEVITNRDAQARPLRNLQHAAFHREALFDQLVDHRVGTQGKLENM